MKTYGEIQFNDEKNMFKIAQIESHAAIMLKRLFTKIEQTKTVPYYISNTPEMAYDLLWFFSRYPFKMSELCKEKINSLSDEYLNKRKEADQILLPNHKPKIKINIKEGQEFKPHQIVAIEYHQLVKHLLLVDAIGSGKTYIAIGAAMQPQSTPTALVVQSHLPQQFKQKIEEFCNLRVHIIKSGIPYKLPDADIYIFKYTILAGWTDLFVTKFFKLAIFDEVQEIRHGTSTSKGAGSDVLCQNVDKVLATTATPLYGYGIEMFNIMDIIKKGCLGTKSEFLREHCTFDGKLVKDPDALGTLLRDNQLMLRRTKAEIFSNKEEPNIIIQNVDYDIEKIKDAEELAKQLAITTLTGSFTEQGRAARELNLKLREYTGISKAKYIALFVRMLVESGEQVLLSGWHREVYEIWIKELSDLGVVLYTGSETTASKKNKSKQDFIDGKAKVMIISHISGAGLDGLQHVCSTVVIGELAWSSKIHEQIIGRVDRMGQEQPVNAFIMIADYGSDPVMCNLLGIKQSQQNGILDPNQKITAVHSNKSRLKELAREFLKSKGVIVEEKNSSLKIEENDIDYKMINYD